MTISRISPEQYNTVINRYLAKGVTYDAHLGQAFKDMDNISMLPRGDKNLKGLYFVTETLCNCIRSVNADISDINELYFETIRAVRKIKLTSTNDDRVFHQTSTYSMDNLRWLTHNGVLSIKMLYSLKEDGNEYDDDKYDELLWIYRDMCHIVRRLLALYTMLVDGLVDNLRYYRDHAKHLTIF